MKSPQPEPHPQGGLLDVSRAFADSLEALNQVLERQRASIERMARTIPSELLEVLIALRATSEGDANSANRGEGGPTGDFAERLEQLASTASSPGVSTAEAVAASQSSGIDLEQGAVKALETAYRNTVTAQNDLNEMAQAVLTEWFALLFSILGGGTREADVERLKAHLSALTNKEPRGKGGDPD